MDLIFDTETTGFFKFGTPANDPIQPDIVQLGMILADGAQIIASISLIVQPEKKISEGAMEAHGITEEFAAKHGVPRKVASRLFNQLASKVDCIVAHNIDFDIGVMATAYLRAGDDFSKIARIPTICTMKGLTKIVKLSGRFGKSKWPTLEEAYEFFLKKPIVRAAHDALEDSTLCHAILCAAREQGHFKTST